MFKAYYYLTKPGIIYGNLLTTAAGFFLASANHINFLTFLGVMLGTAGIIAAACICNNYLDRVIDAKMERTKKRSLVTGKISVLHAFIFAGILGICGAFLLITFTNFLTLIVGVVGFIDYVVFYGLSKRRSIHGTMIGGISGATPILAGYTAVTNTVDLSALFLFLILLFWQMPHFFAIALYRMKDYAAASVPVFSVKRGEYATKIHMLCYLLGFVAMTLLLPQFSQTGTIYFIVMVVVNAYWVWISIQGFRAVDIHKWARKMFLVSLICLSAFSILLIGTPVLP